LTCSLQSYAADGLRPLTARAMRTHSSPATYSPAVPREALYELFFTQSLDGFFIMMLDEPVDWHEGADKDALLEYIFTHQRMTLANEAYARQYARPVSSIIGMTPRDFYSHDVDRGKSGWRALLDAGYLHSETDERRADGQPVRIEGHYLVLRDQQGFVTGHIGIQRDITERHRAAEEVAQSREELRRLAAHLHTVREEERTRIARELHDELGQVLTGLKLDLSWLEHRLTRTSSRDLGERAHDLITRMDAVMVSVRRIITELRPSILDELGLADAIEWQAQDFAGRTGLGLRLEIREEATSVGEPVASTFFRTLQEALTNVMRHAKARSVSVEFFNEAGVLTLRVTDDGGGIPPEKVQGRQSLGLLGLRERAAASGGTVTITPGQRGGTIVELKVPLQSALS
jgi:two-component system sensor histidine kinase UhpB